jgi:hypothetical protein
MADLVITATSVQPKGKVQGTAVQFGEAVTPGQSVYRSTSDNKYYLADCDAASTTVVAGVTLSYASADDFGYIFNAPGEKIDLGATLTVGEIYVVSDTAGNIMPFADLTTNQYLSIIGIATAADALQVRIQNTSVQVA